MPSPPSIRKVNPAESSILYLTASSATLPLSDVNRYVEDLLLGKLSAIDGVASADIFGQARQAVRIQVDPNALALRGIGIDEVANAISRASVNQPTGQLDGNTRGAVIHTEGQLNNAAEFASQIIAYRNGAPVRFADVANVIDGVENPRNYGAWGNKDGIVPAVTVAINRQPGANTVAVVDAVKAALPQLLSQLPPSIKIAVTLDKSSSIRRSVNEAGDIADLCLPGDRGDLRLSADGFGDIHPRYCAAYCHYRHLCRHVGHGLQPRQSVLDGLDAVRRLCRGRRHCDA
jgi:HAE1 family hydrophobic/amphiphilic exporter-1